MAETELDFIVPDWPAPANVRACCTTRRGGVSQPPFAGLNLGDHVGDDPAAVAENRRLLRCALSLPTEPRWLTQVHGVLAQRAESATAGCEGDASYTTAVGTVCAVLTADCLPLLLCDETGSRVAAVHAGWRGLLSGVIEAAVDALESPGQRLLAWLGPAIGPEDFEVGNEVRMAFLGHDPQCAEAFRAGQSDRWLADLYTLARQRLAARGVGRIYGGQWSTFGDPQRFYSFRRDGRTGRMATLIWLADQ